jgi:hypothetical protein
MGLKPSILVWFSLLMEGKMVKGKAAEKITIFKEDNETRKGLQSRGQLAYLPQILSTKQFSSHQFAVFNFNYQS